VNAPKLTQPGLSVVPVLHRERRKRDFKCPVGKWQSLRDAADHEARALLTLNEHPNRRIDRDHGEIDGFVVAGPGTNVDHRAAGAKRGADLRRDPRILLSGNRVRAPNVVIPN